MYSNKSAKLLRAETEKEQKESAEKYDLLIAVQDVFPLEHYGWLHAFPTHQTKITARVFLPRLSDVQSIFAQFNVLPLAADYRSGKVEIKPAERIVLKETDNEGLVTKIAGFVRLHNEVASSSKITVRFYARLKLDAHVFVQGLAFREVDCQINCEIENGFQASHGDIFNEEIEFWEKDIYTLQPSDIYGDSRNETEKID